LFFVNQIPLPDFSGYHHKSRLVNVAFCGVENLLVMVGVETLVDEQDKFHAFLYSCKSINNHQKIKSK